MTSSSLHLPLLISLSNFQASERTCAQSLDYFETCLYVYDSDRNAGTIALNHSLLKWIESHRPPDPFTAHSNFLSFERTCAHFLNFCV